MDTDVNRLSRYVAFDVGNWLIGNVNKREPVKITKAKLVAIFCETDQLENFFNTEKFFNTMVQILLSNSMRIGFVTPL